MKPLFSLALFSFFFLFFVCCQQQRPVQSLAGDWLIRLDPDDVGITEQWYNEPFKEKVQLPGSLQEQGFGNDVDIHTVFTLGGADSAWYKAPHYEKYRQPGNIKVPFCLTPDKHYVGVAWYQKQIKIPSSWKQKTVVLELERTHWETTVFIDGEEKGKQDALSTPHRYTFEIPPGKHQLSIRVDNRVHIPVGLNAHSVSDHTQSNWNGLTGKITLTAKPLFHIDDIQIYPDITEKKVDVQLRFNGKANPEDVTLLFQIETLTGEPVGKPLTCNRPNLKDVHHLEVTVDAGTNILLWSEHTPNLYRLKTVLKSLEGTEEKYTNFGFRRFHTEGTRFYINGQPSFLRGTLECCVFPYTGYPSMDSQYWEKIFTTCKKFGLNHVRFHSWCPPEVAFHAADKIGIYLQVECSAWSHVIGDDSCFDTWIYAESDRILKEYGNHPSFCMMCYGNEPLGVNQVELLSALVDHWKKKDNRRLYTSAAGWPYVENADYWNVYGPRIQGWGAGLYSIINSQPPRTDYDFAATMNQAYQNSPKVMPAVSHEVGQWCVYPNLKEIDKYTGVLKAKNFEIFKETLRENHMSDLADKFLYASGRLQTLCYKADIEASLRTPDFGGFQLLQLNDFTGQGTALVGVVDAFWDTKGYVEGEEFHDFCSHTVPLIRFPKMVWLNNEIINVPLEFAHFGEKPIHNAMISWSINTSAGRPLKKGTFQKDLPIGNCITVGNITYDLNEIKEPKQLIFVVSIDNSSIRNQWNIWVYPAQKQAIENMPYITSQLDQTTIDRLNQGEKVLLNLPRGTIHPHKGGQIPVGFSSIFWNTSWSGKQPPHTLGILCDPKHPAFVSFPNEGFSDYQWWDIVSNCDAMWMDDFPADFRPVIHLIDDWFTNRRLGILFEAKVGHGQLMVCSFDLQKDIHHRPSAAQFRQSILEYMSSNNFHPDKEISLDLIKGLLR